MQTNRISSIDQFRGLAVLSMCWGHYINGVNVIPAWLKRSQDIGLTLTDIGAPLFIFAIGLTIQLSFDNRLERMGLVRTIEHFFKRYLALFGTGALICELEDFYLNEPAHINWSIFQTIGIAGLLALPFLSLPAGQRVMIGLALLAVYQFTLDSYMLKTILPWPMGGLYGTFSWAAMLILATALAGYYHSQEQNGKIFPLSALLMLVVGIALAAVFPVSQHRVSISYVLICLGLSGLAFAAVDFLARVYNMNNQFLISCGKNSYALFIVHYAMLGLIFSPGLPILYSEAPIWLAILEMALLLAGVMKAARWMERRNFVITL